MAVTLQNPGSIDPGWEEISQRMRPTWEGLQEFLEPRLKPSSHNGRPKYRVLEEGLVEAIQSGLIDSENRLPTETELTAITPFSLGTVQRALKGLADAGLVVRKPGLGTIVAPWRWELEHPLHTVFPDESGNLLPVYTQVVSRRRIRGEGAWSDFLGTRAQTVCIKRETNVGGRFDFYSEFYVDGGRYPIFLDLAKRDLNGVNFKHLMAREFHLVVTDVSNRFGIVPAEAEYAAILGVAEGTPCMRQRVYVKSNDAPLYYQEFFYPPHAPELFVDSSLESPLKKSR